MNIVETRLPGVLVIEPQVHRDARGFFLETYQEQRYQEAGIAGQFVQDNRSHSTKGVLRGLHYQLHHPQGKLISVLYGEVFDVAVDIRVGSPTFAQSVGVHLNADQFKQLYIPPGFAHGFCILSSEVEFIYKCTDYYNGDDERGLQWNDPDVAIKWPINDPILSDKDIHNPSLQELKNSGDLPNFQDLQ
jgi:dTDP-4-dehydrorhamnose 3,5-epimerase